MTTSPEFKEGNEQEIIQYLKTIATKNEWVKNPIRDFRWLALRLIQTKGACPCKPKQRPLCPCTEAVSEVKTKGHCLCFEFLHLGYDYYKDQMK